MDEERDRSGRGNEGWIVRERCRLRGRENERVVGRDEIGED